MDLKLSIDGKARELLRLLDKLEEYEGMMKTVKENIDMLQSEFVQLMKENGIIESAVAGVGKVKLSSSLYASILVEDRPVVFQKLRDIGEGGLIKSVESIHNKTLIGFVNGLIKEGKEIPEGIKYGFHEEVKIK
jgi:hypothetical protein